MRKKITLLIVCLLYGASIAFAQDITVKGEVKDKQGLPLPGVSVQIKGAARGTVTTGNGTYSLSAPSDAVLTFSFIGYKAIEQPVAGKSTISVTLSEDNNQLSEVVVI